MVIYNSLRFFRKLYGYTQQDLADLVGVSKNTIYSIERGSFYPNLHTTMNLLRVLHCDFDDLFYTYNGGKNYED